MSRDAFKTTQYAIFLLGLLCTAILSQVAHAEAGPTARITPSGDAIELTYHGEDGTPAKELIPITKFGDISYFSTGIGSEEREAHYPPFPLKIILVAGDRAYLSHAAITIAVGEGVRLKIPAEEVTGPWLFIDLPPGSYKISAARGDRRQEKEVRVRQHTTTTVYFRWPENS